MKGMIFVFAWLVVGLGGTAGIVAGLKAAGALPSRELSLEDRYQYTMDMRLLEALKSNLQSTFTPDQLKLMQEITKQQQAVEKRRAALHKQYCKPTEILGEKAVNGEPACFTPPDSKDKKK